MSFRRFLLRRQGFVKNRMHSIHFPRTIHIVIKISTITMNSEITIQIATIRSFLPFSDVSYVGVVVFTVIVTLVTFPAGSIGGQTLVTLNVSDAVEQLLSVVVRIEGGGATCREPNHGTEHRCSGRAVVVFSAATEL